MLMKVCDRCGEISCDRAAKIPESVLSWGSTEMVKPAILEANPAGYEATPIKSCLHADDRHSVRFAVWDVWN